MNNEFVEAVLRMEIKYDLHDLVHWRIDGDDLVPWIFCSDVFYWGTADGEDLTPENMPLLTQAIADCEAVDLLSAIWGTDLFCARIRQMRPQGAAYPPRELWPLFDACGPEREVGLGNPLAPGELKQNTAVL